MHIGCFQLKSVQCLFSSVVNKKHQLLNLKIHKHLSSFQFSYHSISTVRSIILLRGCSPAGTGICQVSWRFGDLEVLLVSPSCLEFGVGDLKVVLKPRHGYVPKVLST